MNLQAMKRQNVPLHTEVATVLRHRIMSGELEAGARLPALRELSARLGVARMTVIQAMNTLEDEGLIERHCGRGTFVREVAIPQRHTLHMQAEMSQLHSMVSQLEVSVLDGDITLRTSDDGRVYRRMKRVHAKDAKPFCLVEIELDDEFFRQAPERFASEIVVSVLRDIGVQIASARQKVTIGYADFELAQVLGISVNSAVFRVFREFLSSSGDVIYQAKLVYPGDLLELEVEFGLDRT